VWPEKKERRYMKKEDYNECELKELEHLRNTNESRAFYEELIRVENVFNLGQ
jgi:hypothetical protein